MKLKSLIICGATTSMIEDLQAKMPEVELITVIEAIKLIRASNHLDKLMIGVPAANKEKE